MPYQEKSAWVMSMALLAGRVFYFSQVASMSSSLDTLAPPTLPIVVIYTLILAVIAVLGNIVVAALAPGDANTSADERERRIFDRAAHLSGYVLTTGVILSLGLYLLTTDGNTLFYAVFGSLMLGQLAE